MIHPIAFCLLLSFSILDAVNPAYLAVFFTESMRNFLKSNMFRPHEKSSPFFDNSRHVYCEHNTIEFNPRSSSMNKYKAHYGHTQKLTILAYAEDEHAQAILVHTTGGNHSHPSTNEYPHVTLSVSNVKPYTPVYSNDLWKRFVDSRIIDITLDEYDKPRSIAMKDGASEWHGTLERNEKYQETQAYLKILNQTIDLHGTVCVDNLWKQDQCQEGRKIK